MSRIPQRIVCLSGEAADWLWRICAWERVVGVTAFFTAPDGAPPRPRVSGFSTARLKEIEALNPDLIITFSDVQAEFAAELMKAGLPVVATNQRSLAEIEATLSLLGRVAGCEAEAERLLGEFRARLAPAEIIVRRPRIYFEEWNEPLISGIGWVGELIERAGGLDVFAELRNKRAARERVVSAEQVCRADPEIIFASWCGKPVSAGAIASRLGWEKVSAVRSGRVYEIPGDDILQPGFRLVNGYERMRGIIIQVGDCIVR
jgi:iron complex transport system substrate-binding protein